MITNKSETTNPDEIEITPEMMEVGMMEYGLFDSADPPEWTVWAVYKAMVSEAIRSGKIKIIGNDNLP